MCILVADPENLFFGGGGWGEGGGGNNITQRPSMSKMECWGVCYKSFFVHKAILVAT